MNAHATPIERVREAVRQYLDTPESFPLVAPEPCPRMQDRLAERHAKSERRRYLAEPEPITNFGSLE